MINRPQKKGKSLNFEGIFKNFARPPAEYTFNFFESMRIGDEARRTAFDVECIALSAEPPACDPS
jgi:hypothetical protein